MSCTVQTRFRDQNRTPIENFLPRLLFIVPIVHAFIILSAGNAMSSENISVREDLIAQYSSKTILRGSPEQFRVGMRAISELILRQNTYGLVSEDRDVLEKSSSNRRDIDLLVRTAMRPYFVQIRKGLDSNDSIVILAKTLMDAIRSEGEALNSHYREIYDKLSVDGKNRIDTAINNLVTADLVITQTDYATLAADHPELAYVILESATKRFFDGPHEEIDREPKIMEVIQTGDNR